MAPYLFTPYRIGWKEWKGPRVGCGGIGLSSITEGAEEMGENIGLVLILLLSLYGCAELLLAISRRVLSPAKGDRGVLMIPLCGHRTDIEYVARCAAARERWSAGSPRVMLVDTGMDDETRRLAEEVCGRLGQGLYTYEEFEKVLSSGLQ